MSVTVGSHVRSCAAAALVVATGCGRVSFKPGLDAAADAVVDGAVDSPADPPPDGCVLGRWSTPSRAPFGNVNTASLEWGVEISGDGLRLVFASDQRPGHSDTDIYLAERADIGDAFGPPVRLNINDDSADDKDPSLTCGATELYYTRGVGSSSCLYLATRPDAAAATWTEQAQPVRCRGGPYVSRDGKRLYYDIDGEVWMASRAGCGDGFVGDAQVGLSGGTYCALSGDEQTIYCEVTTSGDAQVWQATRGSLTAGFGAMSPVAELASGSADGDPSLTADGRHLVFASTREGSNDIFIVDRACE
jgi:WD40-like Beta Propeller Repeat